MKLFAQIVNGLKSLTVFKKKLHLRYLTWFRLRLCRSSQCVTGWPLKVLYQKSSFEKWLFYKVARWSCGKIFRKLPLSISFLLKLQGTSLQVYQQFLEHFLEHLPTAAIYRILQTHTSISYQRVDFCANKSPSCSKNCLFFSRSAAPFWLCSSGMVFTRSCCLFCASSRAFM